MALTSRAINVSFEQQTAKSFTIKFFPVLTGADEEVLLESEYKFKINADGTVGETGDTLIYLPTKASGNIRYNYEFPGAKEPSKDYFYLSAGAEINLSELIVGGVLATDTVIDYVNSQLALLPLLPSLTGHSGKFLTNDGTDASWEDLDLLPAQSGQSGKFLSTDGTTPSWQTIDLSGYATTSDLNSGLSGKADLTLSNLSSAFTARANLGLAIGINVQPYSASLVTYAGINPSANVQTLLGSADYSAFRSNLGLGTMALEAAANYALLSGNNNFTGNQVFTAVTGNQAEWRFDAINRLQLLVNNAGVAGFTANSFMFYGNISSPTSGFTNTERFGAGSSVSGNISTAIGAQAQAPAGSTVVGALSSLTSAFSTAIGAQVVGTGAGASRQVLIGSVISSSFNNVILLGNGVSATANGQFIAGSQGMPILNVYFGRGVASANANLASITINGTGGEGTDITAADVIIAAGRPTGAGLGGSVKFQTATAGASGTALRSLVDRMTINQSGNVGIGTTTPNANAILDISSTTKALLLPRMTTAQRNALPSPTGGMIVFDTSLGKFVGYTTAWEVITSV